MKQYTVRYNELTAEQFIELWESVWGDGPNLEQTTLAMEHTLFRVSVFDGDRIVRCRIRSRFMRNSVFPRMKPKDSGKWFMWMNDLFTSFHHKSVFV